MRMLVLDASGSQTTVAWLDAEGGCLYEASMPGGRSQEGRLFETIQSASSEFGPAERILAGIGPGSYSGIRQAIAFTQGLRLAWNCELAGWPSPAGISDQPDYQVVGDARRGSYYYTKISSGLCTDGPRLIEKEELGEMPKDLPTYASEPSVPDLPLRFVSAVCLGKAALKSWARALPAEPIYLRDPAITRSERLPVLGKQR